MGAGLCKGTGRAGVVAVMATQRVQGAGSGVLCMAESMEGVKWALLRMYGDQRAEGRTRTFGRETRCWNGK